jgi:hypothetical protein
MIAYKFNTGQHRFVFRRAGQGDRRAGDYSSCGFKSKARERICDCGLDLTYFCFIFQFDPMSLRFDADTSAAAQPSVYYRPNLLGLNLVPAYLTSAVLLRAKLRLLIVIVSPVGEALKQTRQTSDGHQRFSPRAPTVLPRTRPLPNHHDDPQRRQTQRGLQPHPRDPPAPT